MGATCIWKSNGMISFILKWNHFIWILIENHVKDVSRMVGDIRMEPAWGPLIFIKQTSDVGPNIVVDGWAGGANPHLHPTLYPTPSQHRHIHKKHLKCLFSHFSTHVHGRTNGRTLGQGHTASSWSGRVAEFFHATTPYPVLQHRLRLFPIQPSMEYLSDFVPNFPCPK